MQNKKRSKALQSPPAPSAPFCGILQKTPSELEKQPTSSATAAEVSQEAIKNESV